jgi:GNAT superfamily N-acetyltransferase
MNHQLFVDWSPDSRDHAALLKRLADANLASGGPSGHQNISAILRDPETGEAISGIWGPILYGWLFIELVYVIESSRRQGLGSRLMAGVEKGAREQGCVGSWLCAYPFQTPEFFEKNEYEQFAGLGSALGSHAASNKRLLFYRKLFGC